MKWVESHVTSNSCFALEELIPGMEGEELIQGVEGVERYLNGRGGAHSRGGGGGAHSNALPTHVCASKWVWFL